jgi:hypothetical protein
MAGGEIAPASGVGERIEDENCCQLGLLIRIAVNKPTLFTIDFVELASIWFGIPDSLYFQDHRHDQWSLLRLL